MPKTSRQKTELYLTATDVAEFIFCAKAWQLKRDGVAADSHRLAEGTAHHRRHGAQIVWAQTLQRGAIILFIIAVLCLFLWWKLR